MRLAVRLVVGMTLLAVALIGSSWGLKGNSLGDWVDAAIYLAMGYFFASQVILAFERGGHARSSPGGRSGYADFRRTKRSTCCRNSVPGQAPARISQSSLQLSRPGSQIPRRITENGRGLTAS
jgi:hypothetical protein